MAPAYKLTYFDIRGLAEPIRYLFSYGNVEFQDNRLSREDDDAAWKKIKESTPFGQVPLLEHNGKQVNQSLAIQRYVAKQVGLAGKDDWENLEIDALADTINDCRLKLAAFFYEQDPDKKKVIIETFINETAPYFLSRFEARTKQNNGFLATGRLTWADTYFAAIAPFFSKVAGVDILCKYPGLVALVKTVESQPGIKKWIASRPETEF